MPVLRNSALERHFTATGPGETRTGLLLILAGLVPFLAGFAYTAVDGPGLLTTACPFLSVTGLPCPFCGTTRAFAFAASGDLAFLDYNAFWVFAATGLVALGLTVTFTRFSLEGFWSRRDNLAVYLVVATIVAGWACALLNRGMIG